MAGLNVYISVQVFIFCFHNVQSYKNIQVEKCLWHISLVCRKKFPTGLSFTLVLWDTILSWQLTSLGLPCEFREISCYNCVSALGALQRNRSRSSELCSVHFGESLWLSSRKAQQQLQFLFPFPVKETQSIGSKATPRCELLSGHCDDQENPWRSGHSQLIQAQKPGWMDQMSASSVGDISYNSLGSQSGAATSVSTGSSSHLL